MTMEWHEVIPRPSVNTVLGFMGTGKTALGFYLVDELGSYHGLQKVIFGYPEDKVRPLIPRDIIVVNSLDDIPRESIALIDEVWLIANARDSMKSGAKDKQIMNRALNKLTGMSRKRDMIAFLLSQYSRKADVLSLIMECSNVILKKPGRLWIQEERGSLRFLMQKAWNELKDKGPEYSLLYSNVKELEGIMTNPLPDFWSEDLSNIEPEDFGEDEIYGEYGPIVHQIVEYENSMKEDPYIADIGWKWDEINIKPQILHKMHMDGIVHKVYDSKSRKGYLLADGEIIQQRI